ncbi:MAG: hypothetical protein JST38_09285 [Bacteroidetes bacterium]|nr:hypothetical protein [Bacteroidota bacterium]MBS1945707.1 hypothetical protein [Bacteroidota bacterium]
MSLLYITAVFFGLGCSQPHATSIETEVPRKFAIPQLQQTDSSLNGHLAHRDHLDAAWVSYVGKFKFNSKVYLQNERDSIPPGDFIDKGTAMMRSRDSVSTDGLQLMIDYPTTFILKDPFLKKDPQYPAYLYNETSGPKVIWGKDSRLFAIQEALDSSGIWRPIEGQPFDFCGNGRWGTVIHPGEFAVFGMVKYSGDYETKIRVRLVNGNSMYTSQPVKAKINYAQFKLEPDGYFSKELNEDPVQAIQHRFYGSIPLEFKEGT